MSYLVPRKNHERHQAFNPLKFCCKPQGYAGACPARTSALNPQSIKLPLALKGVFHGAIRMTAIPRRYWLFEACLPLSGNSEHFVAFAVQTSFTATLKESI
jgi:hypothetical protein